MGSYTVGYKMLDIGCWILDVGCWRLNRTPTIRGSPWESPSLRSTRGHRADKIQPCVYQNRGRSVWYLHTTAYQNVIRPRKYFRRKYLGWQFLLLVAKQPELTISGKHLSCLGRCQMRRHLSQCQSRPDQLVGDLDRQSSPSRARRYCWRGSTWYRNDEMRRFLYLVFTRSAVFWIFPPLSCYYAEF